jgi:hypothetical protein
LDVKADPKSLLALSQEKLDAIRAPLLRPFQTTFQAPNRVALYLFSNGGWVIENFNDTPVNVTLNGQPLQVDRRGWKQHWK